MLAFRKYLFLSGVIVVIVAIALIPNIIASDDGGEVYNFTEEKTTKVSAKENPKEEVVIDPKIKSIVETLTNFELPKEGRIQDETKRDKLLSNYSNISNAIVYENGFVIDKKTKSVSSLIHFEGVDNVGKPYGTQALAFFKTLLNTNMSEHYALHDYILNENGEPIKEDGFEITDEVRWFMEREVKHYDPSVNATAGWSRIEDSIDSTINSIEKVEEQLNHYDELYTWTQEAKSYFVEAKELGIENWEKAYIKYGQGSKFINELKNILNTL